MVNRLERWMGTRGITGPKWTRLSRDSTQNSEKEAGSDYEPDSLRVMIAELDRHFRANGTPYSVLNDKAFDAATGF